MLLVVFCADGCADQIQAKDNHQKPAAPISTVLQQQHNSPPPDSDEQKNVHADVKIVNPPQKDFYDKAPVWINLSLVLAALLTLWTIKRQADLMKGQLVTARQKERPKLRIQMEAVDLKLADSPDIILIDCKIQNYGGSVAFMVEGVYECSIGQAPDPELQQPQGFRMILPEVLINGGEPCDPSIILPDEDRVVDSSLWDRNDPRIEGIRKGDSAICVNGYVRYENIFGEVWVLVFKRKFTMHSLGHGMASGEWSRDGDAHNYERQEYPRVKGTNRSTPQPYLHREE